MHPEDLLAQIQIHPFQPEDQAAVKDLILAGLGDHWGAIDYSLNPDLNDIASSYANATFLVARQGDEIVGTGALVPRSEGTAEIVRMSVKRPLRRSGLGGLLLNRLIEHAKTAYFRQIVLETTARWEEVIAFYLKHGFTITHYQDGDVYFILDLV